MKYEIGDIVKGYEYSMTIDYMPGIHVYHVNEPRISKSVRYFRVVDSMGDTPQLEVINGTRRFYLDSPYAYDTDYKFDNAIIIWCFTTDGNYEKDFASFCIRNLARHYLEESKK